MKKVFYILFLSTILSLNGKSQQIDAGLQSGLGTYSMKGLKKLNEIADYGLPFDTKLVHDFPMYFYYRPYILVKLKNVSFGPNFTFQSTGSRVSAKDYSGEYRFDMTVNSNSPGMQIAVDLYNLLNAECSLYSVFGALFTNLRMNEYLIIDEEVLTNEKFRFKSFNLYLEPGIKISFPVNFLNFGLNAGYQIQFGNKSFYSTDNKDAKLTDPYSEDPVKPGWSGFRVGLSVSFCFPRVSELPVN